MRGLVFAALVLVVALSLGGVQGSWQQKLSSHVSRLSDELYDAQLELISLDEETNTNSNVENNADVADVTASDIFVKETPEEQTDMEQQEAEQEEEEGGAGVANDDMEEVPDEVIADDEADIFVKETPEEQTDMEQQEAEQQEEEGGAGVANDDMEEVPDEVIADDEFLDLEMALEDDPIVPEETPEHRKPHHIPTALGNVECAKCQHGRYLRCFRQQAEDCAQKSTTVFPACDQDAQEMCQIACWDKLVAVDGIRDEVWKNEPLCSVCRDYQSRICDKKWSTDEEGDAGQFKCADAALSKCAAAGWCQESAAAKSK